MADGFRLVPVEAEVTAGDREIRGDGQLLATARSKKGAIVANAQAESTQGGAGCTLANLAEQGDFASSSRMGLLHPHFPHFMINRTNP
jgi:hypothetical protein